MILYCIYIRLYYNAAMRGDGIMPQTTVSVRVGTKDKKAFESFCKQMGMNVSVAVNTFIKNVMREQKLPFAVEADPFYSEDNTAVQFLKLMVIF